VLVLLEIVLVAVVLFALAAFAVGGVGGMTEVPPERGDDGLPAGDLRGEDLNRARFGLAFRGYRMAEVDAVLDRLRDQLVRYEQQLGAPTGDGSGPPAPAPVPPAPAPPGWPPSDAGAGRA